MFPPSAVLPGREYVSAGWRCLLSGQETGELSPLSQAGDELQIDHLQQCSWLEEEDSQSYVALSLLVVFQDMSSCQA